MMAFGMKEPWIKGLVSQILMEDEAPLPLAAIQCTDNNIGETNKASRGVWFLIDL